MMVLPALGGEVMRLRAPRPMGAMRSRTRPTSSSDLVSMTSFSVGSVSGEVGEGRAPYHGQGVGALELVHLLEHPLHAPDRGLAPDEVAGLQMHPVDEPAGTSTSKFWGM